MLSTAGADGQPPTTRSSYTPSAYCGHLPLTEQVAGVQWSRVPLNCPPQLLHFPVAAFSVLKDECIFINVRCKAVANLLSLEVEGLEVLRLECSLKKLANEVPGSSMSATDRDFWEPAAPLPR